MKLSRRDVLQWSAAGAALPAMLRISAADAEGDTGSAWPARETEVCIHFNAPTLFINGRPHPGLTFFFARAQDCADDIRRFAAAGIHLFSGVFGLPSRPPPGQPWDFGEVRKRLDYVIAANPRVLILLRVGVGWRGAAERADWQDQVQLDVHPRDGGRSRPGWLTFASPAFHELASEGLRELVRFCEERYGDHVLGYHLAAGAAGEWSYAWKLALSDYSPAQAAAFRAWLRDRYAGDRSRLAKAWNDTAADFATAEVPLERGRREGQLSVFDPARERPLIDYLTFHSEAAARAIVHCCKVCKQTLQELRRKKICGAFYGYHFKNLNKPYCYQNEGHFAGNTVLTAPEVDFICGPYGYSGREPGGMYLAQLVAGSVRLHGKLYYCEDDTFTFLSKRESHRSWCPDRDSTVGVLRRNLMGILRDGGTAWYMDCGGNGPRNPAGQVEGWYRDEGLMRNFAEMQRLARQRLDRADHTPAAQVAVVVSDASVAYQRQDAALCDALVFHQMLQLGPLGASFDTYRIEDLPLLIQQPWCANYRLWIFLGTLHVGQNERAAIERLKADKRTLLWVYGCGLLTEDAISRAAMESLTGLRVDVRLASESLLINCFATGTRTVFGTERPVGPVIIGADPRATASGWFVNTGDAGFLTRDFGGWRSVWSGAPALPTAVLRHFARQAAVHIYVDTGDQVLSENGYLAVHAGSDGERTVRLPKASNVADAVTGKPIALAAREFRAALRRAETKIWTIDELPNG